MTTHLMPRSAPPDEFFEPGALARSQIIWRARFTIIGVAVLIAAATWAVSSFLPGTYRASSDVLVTTRGGLASVDTVSGTNDLATQYAQFAGTSGVLNAAAQESQIPVGGLGVLVSTVGNTNIIRITVTADSANRASKGALAISNSLIAEVQKLTATSDDDSAQLKEIDQLLTRAKADVVRLTDSLGGATPGSARSAVLSSSLSLAQQQVLALTLKRVDVISQTSREESARGVRLTLLTTEPGAGKVSPRPFLYTTIGLIAALVIMTELAVVSGRRRDLDHRSSRHRPTLAG